MINLKKCCLCGNKKFKKIYYLYDKANNIKKYFTLVQCEKCGVMFVNPQPSFKELEKHYSNKYYSLGIIKELKDSRKVRLRKYLYDLYFNSLNKNGFFKILFSPIKNYLRGSIIKPKTKLLDVGSGSGQFLYEMKNFGLDVFGVEPSNFNKENSKKHGLKIKNNDLISAKFPKEFFDLITMNQVLEHVSNPPEIIKEIYRILNKKGTLIIAVPNKDSLAHKFFKEDWYQLDVPRHLFHFSEKILIKKLSDRGFKIKKTRHVSRASQFTISLRRKFNLKKNLKILEPLFLPITWFLNLIKKGDSIEIWCTK